MCRVKSNDHILTWWQYIVCPWHKLPTSFSAFPSSEYLTVAAWLQSCSQHIWKTSVFVYFFQVLSSTWNDFSFLFSFTEVLFDFYAWSFFTWPMKPLLKYSFRGREGNGDIVGRKHECTMWQLYDGHITYVISATNPCFMNSHNILLFKKTSLLSSLWPTSCMLVHIPLISCVEHATWYWVYQDERDVDGSWP